MMIKKIILGTVQFGLNYGINNRYGKISKKEAFNILDYSYHNNIKILDTAEEYGNAQEIIGEYLKEKPNKFEINTKFKIEDKSIHEQLERNLKLLNKDNINVYFYHSFNDFLAYPNSGKELLVLKAKGKINKIGVSVYENRDFLKAIKDGAIDVIQFPFNLLDNLQHRNYFINKAKENNKELQARSVFLQGLFFKDVNSLTANIEPLKPYLLNIQKIASKNNIGMESLALSYVLKQEKINHVLLGIDSLQQFKANLNAINEVISDKTLQEINNVNVKDVELLYPKNW